MTYVMLTMVFGPLVVSYLIDIRWLLREGTWRQFRNLKPWEKL